MPSVWSRGRRLLRFASCHIAADPSVVVSEAVTMTLRNTPPFNGTRIDSRFA